jgi:hypothetical protein
MRHAKSYIISQHLPNSKIFQCYSLLMNSLPIIKIQVPMVRNINPLSICSRNLRAGIQGAFLTPFSAVLETTSKLDVRASPPNIH